MWWNAWVFLTWTLNCCTLLFMCFKNMNQNSEPELYMTDGENGPIEMGWWFDTWVFFYCFQRISITSIWDTFWFGFFWGKQSWSRDLKLTSKSTSHHDVGLVWFGLLAWGIFLFLISKRENMEKNSSPHLSGCIRTFINYFLHKRVRGRTRWWETRTERGEREGHSVQFPVDAKLWRNRSHWQHEPES